MQIRGLSLECWDLSQLLVERHSTLKSCDKSQHSKERPLWVEFRCFHTVSEAGGIGGKKH